MYISSKPSSTKPPVLVSETPIDKFEEMQYQIAMLDESREQKESRLNLLGMIGHANYSAWIAPHSFLGSSDYIFEVPTPWHAHQCEQWFGHLKKGYVFRTPARRTPSYIHN